MASRTLIIPNRSGGDFATSPVALHLICLSTQTVSETYGTLDDSATFQDIANAMWSIKTSWPLGGRLVINVNHEQSWGRSFLPLDLVRSTARILHIISPLLLIEYHSCQI